MENKLITRIKKLALSYGTGWEYIAESQEAGSVLTDAFLEMIQDNKSRYENIWEKHRLEFLSAIPGQKKEVRRLKTGISVKCTEESQGRFLSMGTEGYTVSEQGGINKFIVETPIQLTAAKLSYVIYQKGFSSWLIYERNSDNSPSAADMEVFAPDGSVAGKELVNPVFKWHFANLCNGRENIRYTVEFVKDIKDISEEIGELPRSLSISDGRNTYFLKLCKKKEKFEIYGEVPRFKENLSEVSYELKLEIPIGEALSGQWLDLLYGGFRFTEEARDCEPELCITDKGVYGGSGIGGDSEDKSGSDNDNVRIYPFTDTPEPALCCYFACDSVIAGIVKSADVQELTASFTESFEIEEKLPKPYSKEYLKLCKKYPWLDFEEKAEEWKITNTVWEYFDGNFWKALPNTGDWQTCCGEDKETKRFYKCKIPGDMKECSVEGEEHFYIRLRADKVDNAYAAYYRKKVPVLENIRFGVNGQCKMPYKCELPDISEADSVKLHLGFDHEVTSSNSWYTGSEGIAFLDRQIAGRDTRFGREAFWVESEPQEIKDFSVFIENYIEVSELLDDTEAFEAEAPTEEDSKSREAYGLKFPTGASFFIKTKDMGIMDAVSVRDAWYDKEGAVFWEESHWRENYFAGYGRLISHMDIDMLLAREYPDLRVSSCSYQKEKRELTIKLSPRKDCNFEDVKKDLPEIREWLENAVHAMGLLWLKDCYVNCILRKPEFKSENKERETSDGGKNIIR